MNTGPEDQSHPYTRETRGRTNTKFDQRLRFFVRLHASGCAWHIALKYLVLENSNYIAFFRNSSIPTSSVIIKLERVGNVSNNLIMANTVNGFYLQCHFKKTSLMND